MADHHPHRSWQDPTLDKPEWLKSIQDLLDRSIVDLTKAASSLTGIPETELRRRIRGHRLGTSQEAIALTWSPDNGESYEIGLSLGLSALLQHLIKIFACTIDDRFMSSLSNEDDILTGASWSPRILWLARTILNSYWDGTIEQIEGISLNELQVTQVVFALQILPRAYRYLVAHEFGHVIQLIVPDSHDVFSRVERSLERIELDDKVLMNKTWLAEFRADLLARDLLLELPYCDGLAPQFSNINDVAQVIDCFAAELVCVGWILLERYYQLLYQRPLVSESHPDSRLRLVSLRTSLAETSSIGPMQHKHPSLVLLQRHIDSMLAAIDRDITNSFNDHIGQVRPLTIEEAVSYLQTIVSDVDSRKRGDTDTDPEGPQTEDHKTFQFEPHDPQEWNRLGHECFENGNAQGALNAYKQLIAYGEEVDHPHTEAVGHINVAATYLATGGAARAKEHLLRAQGLMYVEDDGVGYAYAIANLIEASKLLNDVHNAESYVRILASLLIPLGPGVAFDLTGPMDLGLNSGRPSSRKYQWERTSPARLRKPVIPEASVQELLDLLRRGDTDQAAALFERVCRPDGSGWTFIDRPALPEGLKLVSTLLCDGETRDRLSVIGKLTEYLQLAGLLTIETGYPRLAVSFFAEATRIHLGKANKAELFSDYYNLITAAIDLGELPGALSLSQDLFGCAESIGLPYHLSSTWSLYGYVLSYLGQSTRADDAFRKAELYEQRNPMSLARFGENTPYWAEHLLREGRYDDAYNAAKGYLDICGPRGWHEQELRCRVSIASADIKRGDHDEALNHLRVAESIIRRHNYDRYLPRMLAALARLHLVNEAFDESRMCIDEAIAVASDRHFVAELAEAHLLRAQVSLHQISLRETGLDPALLSDTQRRVCKEIEDDANRGLLLSRKTQQSGIDAKCYAALRSVSSKIGDIEAAKRLDFMEKGVAIDVQSIVP